MGVVRQSGAAPAELMPAASVTEPEIAPNATFWPFSQGGGAVTPQSIPGLSSTKPRILSTAPYTTKQPDVA
jgi:hypothetical protein